MPEKAALQLLHKVPPRARVQTIHHPQAAETGARGVQPTGRNSSRGHVLFVCEHSHCRQVPPVPTDTERLCFGPTAAPHNRKHNSTLGAASSFPGSLSVLQSLGNPETLLLKILPFGRFPKQCIGDCLQEQVVNYVTGMHEVKLLPKSDRKMTWY